LFWDEDVEKESYYFANLCGYSSKLHKPYGEWVEVQKQKRDNKDNIFSSVGGDNIIKEDDLSWLDSI
jgi:hypothetical protein